MIRALDRLVISTFLKLFLAFVLTAPILFIVGDLTDKLEEYLDLGVTWKEAGKAYLLQYPHFMFWSFPIAAMIAVVFTVHGMTTHREVMAAKAGGISFRRLVFPLFVLAILLCGVNYGLSELAPRLNRQAADLRRGAEGIRPGDRRPTFSFKPTGNETLSAAALTVSTGFLDEPRFEISAGTGVVRDIMGRRAVYSTEGWTFHEGVARSYVGEPRELHEFSFAELLVKDIHVTPEALQQRKLNDDEMTREELWIAAGNLRGSDAGDTNTARNYLVERELRWALAAAALVIILFGAPLATSAKRGGTAFGVGVSVGSTIVYMLLLRLAKAFGTIGLVPAVWAAWTPNAIFLVVGLVLLFRVRT